MDPLQTLREILNASDNHDYQEVLEKAEVLHEWFGKRGFCPDLSKLTERDVMLLVYAAVSHCRKVAFDQIELWGTDEEIEVAREIQPVPEVVTAPPELDENFDDDDDFWEGYDEYLQARMKKDPPEYHEPSGISEATWWDGGYPVC